MRRLRAKAAREALARAGRAARQARIPALTAEVESAVRILEDTRRAPHCEWQGAAAPARGGRSVLASNALVVDACRHVVRHARTIVSLATASGAVRARPRAGRSVAGRRAEETLVARAFGAQHVDESHRARLRVEVGRLRTALRTLADVSATTRGFTLTPRRGRDVVVLARPVDEEHAAVLAFLADGESWSSSALALALRHSQRTVQRALDALAAAGKVQSFGRGRARRWMTPPVPGFATTLLLPAPLPID